jgi:predicted tellurium resistance membrane protein TerC
MDHWLTPEALLSLVTLTGLEIVLGIDNIIFISILAGRLPASRRESARRLGLGGALLTRLALLSAISWLAQLTTPFFSVLGVEVSGKSLLLLLGGVFLLFKATREIHHKLEGATEETHVAGPASSFGAIVIQIMLMDLVFSIDSVITAVGMAPHLETMVAANVIALAIMVVVGKLVGDFVERHPTVKVLALSFLLMIGLVLVADGIGFHIPKAYVYFAMGFSVFVEFINLRATKGKPVPLHKSEPPL